MRRTRLLLFAPFVASLAACGGGGATPTPSITATSALPGQGSSKALDQRIALTVILPPPGTPIVQGRTRRGADRVARPSASDVYLSPQTGSIVLSLESVDGLGFINVPPPIAPINPSSYCSGPVAGCTFTTPANIPAAKGVDRYIVTTYAGQNGTGNVVSTGFIDVTVPAPAPATLGGGATLTTGGYVARIALGSVAPLAFAAGQPGTIGLLLQAFDPAGAAIVGNTLYANPVTMSISDIANFSLAGSNGTLSVAGPIATPIPLAYNGGVSLSGTASISASTVDENGAPASAPPIVATIVGTPPPTPPPSANDSLYVDVNDTDQVEEFDAAAAIENGTHPGGGPAPVVTATPRRTITLATPAPAIVPNLSCNPTSIYGSLAGPSGTNGIAVGDTGSIYLNPSCYDGTSWFTFGFPATARGVSPPSILDRINTTALGIAGLPNGGPMAIDAKTRTTYAQNNGNDQGGIFAFAPDASNGSQIAAIGYVCFPELPLAPPYCSVTNPAYFAISSDNGFAASSGYLFQPGYYQLPTTGPGNYAPNAGAVDIVPALDTQNTGGAALPASVIAGPTTSLTTALAGSATIEGNMLYVLNDGADGLANCSLAPNATCADGLQHSYVTAYRIDASFFPTVPANIDASPVFVLGGDATGGFGDTIPSPGEYLAVHNGFLYVLNPVPNNGVQAPEVDVYDTRTLSGLHTDVAPIARLTYYANGTSQPTAIAIGPIGPASSIGGLSSRRTPHAHLYRNRLGRRAIRARRW